MSTLLITAIIGLAIGEPLKTVRAPDCQCTLCRCGNSPTIREISPVPMPAAPVTIQPAPAIRYTPVYQASYETAAPARRGFFGLFRGRAVKYCGPGGCN